MQFKGVLLDLDNTLYDYETAHLPALAASFDWLKGKLNLPDDTIRDAYKKARAQINEELSGQGASHSRLLYFQRLNELLGYNPCLTALEAEEIYWSTFLGHMRLRYGAREFLNALDAPIAIVTDLTAQIQFRKINRLNIENKIRAIVSSEEAGAEKPHPRIFALALNKLAIDATNACMIGDNWDRDIVGATNLGIRSFWYKDLEETNRTPNGRNRLVTPFESFEELIELFSDAKSDVGERI